MARETRQFTSPVAHGFIELMRASDHEEDLHGIKARVEMYGRLYYGDSTTANITPENKKRWNDTVLSIFSGKIAISIEYPTSEAPLNAGLAVGPARAAEEIYMSLVTADAYILLQEQRHKAARASDRAAWDSDRAALQSALQSALKQLAHLQTFSRTTTAVQDFGDSLLPAEPATEQKTPPVASPQLKRHKT